VRFNPRTELKIDDIIVYISYNIVNLELSKNFFEKEKVGAKFEYLSEMCIFLNP